MRGRRSTRALMLATLAFWVLSSAPAHAYIDPGSGSYLLQVLVGGLLGAAFAVKMFWRRVWGFFSSRGRRQ